MAIRPSWIRDQRYQVSVIGLVIVVLAALPWFVPYSEIQAHNILHHLNFLPLMVAGMLFGWNGAIIGTLFTLMVHFPHVYRNWSFAPVDTRDQIVEILIFGAAGVIAGFLSDRERRQRANVEKTKRELEHVHQELQQNIERLKKAERLYAAGQLSASLAHEIRNPLASISGAAGILKRGHASGQNVKDCLEIIEKETQRLNKLLTAFLDFARPRAPRFQATDLVSVIDSVTSLLSHSSEFETIHLRREVMSPLPEIECDPEQLKQVLLNLLINAAEASPANGTVWIFARRERDRITISVRDEGPGIAFDQRERIFDPFFTTKENGTGLGLAIASMIVEQHGGLLDVEQNTSEGMTFRLELPARRTQRI
jgi:signal transduction histidine kinase